MAELDSVPGFERPMGAGTRDVLLSEDELGNKTYRNPTTGVTYTIRPNRDQRTALRKAKDWWNAGAELPTAGQVVEAVAGLPAAVYDTAQRTLRNEATLGEAMSFAPAMGAASLPFEAPEGAVRIFGGRKAHTFSPRLEDEAANYFDDLIEQGVGPEAANRVVWEDFGLWFDENNQPVFEIPNSSMSVRLSLTELKNEFENGIRNDRYPGGAASVPLSYVIDFKELLDAYPNLADTTLRITPGNRVGGSFNASKNELNITSKTLEDENVFREVVLHELQHGVQAHEGTSGGANSRWALGYDSSTGTVKPNDPYLQDAADKYNDMYESYLADEPYDGRYLNELDLEKARGELSWLAFRRYQANRGEVEARAAAARDQLTSSELRETTPGDSMREALLTSYRKYRGMEMPTARMNQPRRQYAEGGAVPMEDQMKFAFMADGGMIDDGKKVEPTTGNKVPPGSLANEVKDHVNAKLSPGEYVLPADVVQYYGLDKIEKLVGKAKEGLADLESRGRIGGKQDSEEDDLPFSDEELKSMDSEDEDEDEDELEFAEGGAVPQTSGMHNRIYVDSQGTEHNVLFMGNMPLGFIDPTWRLKTQQVQEEVKAPETTVEAVDTGGDSENNTAEGPKGPDQWSLEDFQKFDPSGSPLGPIGNVLGGLGAGGGLISWGLEAMRQGTVNRAYEEIQNRLQNPDLDEQTKASYTEQLERYRQARENPQRNTGRTSGGLLGNLFGGDGLLGSMFGGNRQQTTTPTNTPRTPAPVAAPAGLGGGDDNNYAPSSSPRPQARSAAQASPGARGVGGETQKVTTTTGSGRNQRTETKNQSTNPGGFDKESGSWSVGPMAEGGLVARPKRRNKPKK